MESVCFDPTPGPRFINGEPRRMEMSMSSGLREKVQIIFESGEEKGKNVERCPILVTVDDSLVWTL